MSATLLPATAIPNKEHRAVAAGALALGWTLERMGNDHFRLSATGPSGGKHVVRLSGTPSKPSPDRIQKDLERCHAGTCSHGGRVHTSAVEVESRRAAAAERQADELRRMEDAAMAKSKAHVPNKPKLTVVKPSKRKPAVRPKYVKALKWARWYVADEPGKPKRETSNAQLRDAAEAAGHSWNTAREALIEAGAVPLSRGRGGTTWSYPVTGPVEVPNTQSSEHEACVGDGQAHTPPADPVSSGESLTGMELERELGRLEGMVSCADAIMGTGTRMSEQLERVLRLMGENA